MKWFKHMADASNDEFIVELEDLFGMDGYGRWWKLLECIAIQMKNPGDCSASFPVKKWQTLLKAKRKKLETFLEHLEKKQRISTVSTGNLLKIKCPKLLEIRDNHVRNLQATNKKVSLDTDTDTDVDTDVDKETHKRNPDSVLILNYLNDKTGKSFKPTNANLKIINARFSEGYTVDDLKYVVDNRVAYWFGTGVMFGDKPAEEYLRPSTLFNSEKCGNYHSSKMPSEIAEAKPKTLGSKKMAQVKRLLKDGPAPIPDLKLLERTS